MIKRRKKVHAKKINVLKHKQGTELLEPAKSQFDRQESNNHKSINKPTELPPKDNKLENTHKWKPIKLSTDLASRFTMRPSEFSPLPVGPVENDPETESDTDCAISGAKKVMLNTEANMEQFASLHSINHTTGCRTLLFDPIVISVEEESPALNSGNVEMDCKFIQQINAARCERNGPLQVAQIC